MSQENAYAAPAAELIDHEQAKTENSLFTVSINKLVIMNVLTLNMYCLYWVYKNWQLQKLHANHDCMPVLRAIFQIFFTHSLFGTVHETATIKDIKANWSPNLLATLYVILLLVGTVIEFFSSTSDELHPLDFVSTFVPLLIIFPMMTVQTSINQINSDPKGLENSKLTWINWIFVILGTAWWLMIGIAMVDMFLG